MHTIDPRLWLPDTNASPVYLDQELDLMNPGNRVSSSTSTVMLPFVYTVPKNMILVVKALSFWCKQRVNTTVDVETVRYITPTDGDGFFSFEPVIDDNAVYVIEHDWSLYQTAAGTGIQRQKARGFTQLSLTPLDDANRNWWNPLSSFAVPGQKTLTVQWRILPLATTAPLPYGYSVGGATVGTRRVDFAGVALRGQLMSEQFYRETLVKVQAREGV